jgi:hypothetical protein
MFGCQAQQMAVAKPGVEDRVLTEIAASEAELRRLEPGVDDRVIQGLVEASYDELMPAKVHNYVSILIVHQVRDILRDRQAAA